jgi:antitoxin component YwqK of YwqJK toxin-antitoxin module
MRTAVVAIALSIVFTAGICAENTLKQDGSTITFFDDAGQKIAEQALDDDEKVVSVEGVIPDGKIVEYDDEEKLAAEYHYLDGLRDGITKYFYATGKLYAEISYVKGVQNGATKYFHENGKIMAAFTFLDGEREGVGKGYNADGKLSWDAHYKTGFLNGTCTDYYPNGKPAVVKTYSEGKLTGKKAYESGGALIKDKKLTLYKEAVVDILPQSVLEYGGGKFIQISRLNLGKNGLTGSLQLDWIQSADFILAIYIKTAAELIVVYKDIETELTGAYEFGGGVTPMFSSRGYTLKGSGKRQTVEFTVAGSAGDVYDISTGPKTVTVFCLDGSVNPRYFPDGDDGIFASISNVLTASVK